MSDQLPLWEVPDDDPDRRERKASEEGGVPRRPARDAKTSKPSRREAPPGKPQGRQSPAAKRGPGKELEKLWLEGPDGPRQLAVDKDGRIIERVDRKVRVVAEYACFQPYGERGQRQVKDGVYCAGDRIYWGKLDPKPVNVWHNPWWEQSWSDEGEWVQKTDHDALANKAKLMVPPRLASDEFEWLDRGEADRQLRRGRPQPPARSGPGFRACLHLYEHGYQLGYRLVALFWADRHPTVCSRKLEAMWRAGYLERGRGISSIGSAPYVYALTKLGFKLIEDTTDGFNRVLVPTDRGWQPRSRTTEPSYIEHDLRASAAACELSRIFEPYLGGPLADAAGLEECRLRLKGRSAWIGFPKGARREDPYSNPHKEQPELEPIAPDGSLCGYWERDDSFEILLELDKTGRADYNQDKLERYRDLVAGDWRLAKRNFPEPPLVLFVCSDVRGLRALMTRANKSVAYQGTFRPPKEHPARGRILFCLEPELYGSEALAVYALPEEVSERKQLKVRTATLPEAFTPAPEIERRPPRRGHRLEGVSWQIVFDPGLCHLPAIRDGRD